VEMAAGKAGAAEAEASKAGAETVLAMPGASWGPQREKEVAPVVVMAAVSVAATGAGLEEARAVATEVAAMAAAARRETTCQQTAYPSTLQRQHQCSARQTRRQGSRSAQ
jgi:hypothetical protein